MGRSYTDDEPRTVTSHHGGGHNHGIGRQPYTHKPAGSVAPLAWAENLRRRVSSTTKSPNNKAASEEATRQSTQPCETSGATQKAMSIQRRGQVGSVALCHRLLCQAGVGGRGQTELAVTTQSADELHEPHAPGQMPIRLNFIPLCAGDKARRTKSRPLLWKSWIRERHRHPPYPACTITHRGVGHCCVSGHQRYP